jgi:hypothetical protein
MAMRVMHVEDIKLLVTKVAGNIKDVSEITP